MSKGRFVPEISSEKKPRLDLLTLRAIPKGVWALGLVSLFMDVSSEMIHALLPIYLVTVLGISTLSVGIIEGIAEATAAIVKIFSGAISDWLGKRKLLAAIGYGLAAFTKPVFPLAASVGWLVAARFVDRVGKGIRGAPRDALVADITPQALRGASFGLRQSLDTIGAFLGPLAAIGLMLWTANSFKTVFWIAVIPAFVSLGLILFVVKEPPRDKPEKPPRFPLATRRNQPFAAGLLAGRRLFVAIHARPFQRGIPCPQGAGNRFSDCSGACHTRADECHLCSCRLSGRRAFGWERTGATGCW